MLGEYCEHLAEFVQLTGRNDRDVGHPGAEMASNYPHWTQSLFPEM